MHGDVCYGRVMLSLSSGWEAPIPCLRPKRQVKVGFLEKE